MDSAAIIAIVTTFSALSGILGYFLMRSRFISELEISKKREEELARKAYETSILKEIGDRIGYALDVKKIVEIISGSLGKLIPYSTVSYMTSDKKAERLFFTCNVHESVSPNFVKEVKTKMLASFCAITDEPYVTSDLDESITGGLLDEDSQEVVKSFFNLPIFVSKSLVGLINVASTEANLYTDENTEVMYRIANQASDAFSKLHEILEREKERLSQAVQSLSDGLFMVDTDYQLVLVNERLKKWLGLVDESTLFDIVNSFAGKLDVRTKMEEALAKDEPLPAQEIKINDKILEVLVSRVMDTRSDKPMGVVVLFHDITDAKSLERLRQEFSAMMVHELRAPLTTIKSTVQLLLDDVNKIERDQLEKELKTIDSTSRSMLTLLNDLLDVDKIEAGQFDVVCEAGDLTEIVKEKSEEFRPIIEAKNIKYTIEVEEDLPKVWFDKVRIKQVLNNLISNAIKYTDTGEIKVIAKKEMVGKQPVDILVSVVDTGIGIDPEEIGKLFNKFAQLSAGRDRKGVKGTGLGLYIAKDIVEKCGGTIGVKSGGAGLGSTFYFTVPVAAEAKDGKIENSGEIFSQNLSVN